MSCAAPPDRALTVAVLENSVDSLTKAEKGDVMSLREIILQLVQLAIFFAFPTIWDFITRFLPWWPLDPESTANILVFLAVTLVSWLLGVLGIRRFLRQLRTRGLAADVTAA